MGGGDVVYVCWRKEKEGRGEERESVCESCRSIWQLQCLLSCLCACALMFFRCCVCVCETRDTDKIHPGATSARLKCAVRNLECSGRHNQFGQSALTRVESSKPKKRLTKTSGPEFQIFQLGTKRKLIKVYSICFHSDSNPGQKRSTPEEFRENNLISNQSSRSCDFSHKFFK